MNRIHDGDDDVDDDGNEDQNDCDDVKEIFKKSYITFSEMMILEVETRLMNKDSLQIT